MIETEEDEMPRESNPEVKIHASTTVRVETWKPGDQSLMPVSCPVCGSIGTAKYMPEHLIEAHRDGR